MCYDIELLQQIIDNEYEGDVQEVLAHIKICPACRENFEKLKQEDQIVEKVLQTGMITPRRRPISEYSIRTIKNEKKRGNFKMNTAKKRFAAVAAGIILCGGLFIFEPVRAKAQDLLKMFRVQEITGISISQSDIHEIERLFEKGEGMKEIENFGRIEVTSEDARYSLDNLTGPGEIKEKMPSAKVIPQTTKFNYGYASIIPETNVILELDVNKVNDFLEYVGERNKLPMTIHQKTFTIHTEDVLNYSLISREEGNDYPKHINISQMEVPTLEIPSDVDEKELLDALFSMSFLPSNLKRQLMGISDLTSTLPIPYSADSEVKRDIVVRGEKAVLIESKEREYNYFRLFFKEGNTLYSVDANNCTIDEVLPLIESME